MEEKNITSYHFFKQLTQCSFIEKIILFGSRARKDNRPLSDFDIAIVCPTATQDNWHYVLDIIDEADTLLSIDCLRFDTLKESNPIKEKILHEGVVVYDRQKC